MFALFSLLILAYLARWVVTEWRDDSRALRPDPEVARLREEVDELSAKVRRLAEEHAFMVTLLAAGEKPAELAPPHDPETNEIRNPETPDGHA